MTDKPSKPDLAASMSRAARGDAPVWREAVPSFPRSFTLPLDDQRHELLRRLAFDRHTSAGILLRALIDYSGAHPEVLKDLAPAIKAETAALRRRKVQALG